MYCPDADLVARLRASVPAGEAVVPTSCWRTFQRSAATMESLVVVLPGHVTGDAVERLTGRARRKMEQIPTMRPSRKKWDDLLLSFRRKMVLLGRG
jgi:hypothetical protein